MKKIVVRILNSPNLEELASITGAARMTMVRGAKADDKPFNAEMVKKLMALGHTSPLEHATLQVSIEGASRVFLAQIRTHRIASFTSASQQYQKHDGFDYLEPPFPDTNAGVLLQIDYRDVMGVIDDLYQRIEAVMGRDWARYVLPGACRNILLITANLREWFETIVPLRACRRNTPETLYVIALVLQGAYAKGLSAFIESSGPACLTAGKCDQGTLSCGKPLKAWQEMLLMEEVDAAERQPSLSPEEFTEQYECKPAPPLSSKEFKPAVESASAARFYDPNWRD